jgi:aspartyl-tRNA(Asn)/glutamyl-tRNA(Gln) amidotransferase subunit B
MTDNFKTVIGLEIHAQLNTERKMFCGCNNNAEGKDPNAVTCPRCLGMPGTLPVTNQEAIFKAIQIGLVFGSTINSNSKFDRKHYFYPDLPKGYQISQYDQPICIGGQVEINTENGKKIIHFNRIHLEEDAGKLTHPAGKDYTLVDLNRASTPLIEMVTEPDLSSP